MRRITTALVASGIGIATLVPATYAYAQTSSPAPTPICTEEQRAERWAVRAERERRFGDLPQSGYARRGAGLGGGRGMGGGNGPTRGAPAGQG